ncbi:alpha/beta hydrolase fold [[Actinomadura] parvosata subsp. kistnae]|nr:alpha/beta hydrolase fold [Actinomadura parvosata subsp. kistnae]
MVMSMPHRTVPIDGLDVFYREAGDPSAPTLVLLHGFPTSPAAYQELMAALSGEFHLAAPGYPSFGHSSAPTPTRGSTPSTSAPTWWTDCSTPSASPGTRSPCTTTAHRSTSASHCATLNGAPASSAGTATPTKRT